MNDSEKNISKLRTKAEKIFRQEGLKLPKTIEKNWNELLEELNIYHIELEQQNIELQKINEKAEHQKIEYENLYQNAPNAYFEIDRKLQIKQFNKSALTLLKTDAHDLLDKKITKFISPKYQDNFHKLIINSRKKQTQTSELELLNLAGESKKVILSIEENILNKEFIRISATDISNEEDLIHANTFKEEILDNANDCIFTTNEEGIITYWGEGAHRLLGFKEYDLIGKKGNKLFNLNESEFNELLPDFPDKKSNQHELEVKDIKNQRILLEVRISYFEYINTEPQYIFVGQDISKRKENELIKQHSKDKIDFVLNSINNQIYISDPDTLEVLYANNPMLETFGTIKSAPCFKAIFNKKEQCEFCRLPDLKKDKCFEEINTELYNRNNGRWYKVHEKKIPWTTEKDGVIHTLTDITEIKKAEQEKLEQSEMLDKITGAANDGIIVIDNMGRIKFRNSEASNIFGYNKDELIGKNVHELLPLDKHKDAAKQGMKLFAKTGKGNVINETYELKARRKSGSIINVELSVASVKIKNEWNAIGIIRDITTRKTEQIKLQESETRFRSIVDSIKEAIYIHDFSGRFLECNNELVNISGYSYDEFKKMQAKDLLPEKSEKAFFENIKQLQENKQIIFTTLIKTKNGKNIPVEINATIITYKKQKAVLISGRDISDRLKEHRKLTESEHRFRGMVDNLTDAIYIHKFTGEIIDTNQQATKMLGYSRKEFLSMTPLDFSKKTGTEKEFEEKLEALKQTGKFTFEEEHITKKGEIIPVEIAASITEYKGEEIVFSIARNITDRKEAEKEQSKLIDQLNYLSSSATKFISLNTFDEIYRYLGKSLNKALENSMVIVGEFEDDYFSIIDYFGLNKNLLGVFRDITDTKSLKRNFKPNSSRLKLYRSGYLEKLGDLNNLFDQYFDGETLKKVSNLIEINDARIIGVSNGQELYAGITILLNKPLETIDIEFTQALVYQASIAIQRKTYEYELIKTKEKAETANKAKTAFLSNISHEIRTPLNTIMGFTEILSNLNDDPQKNSYINSITSSSKNLLMIINDILDLSKIESGSMQINMMPISIKTLCDNIDYSFRKTAENKNLEFIIDIDKDVPDMIQMDQPRLRQVLHNLVSNAIKFTSNGSVKIKISMENRRNCQNIIFSIEDTGIGFDQEKTENILMPFSQEDTRDARKFEGPGMGLSIANKLTEMLNGILFIDSKPGSGSTFTVKLNNIKTIFDQKEEHPAQLHYNFNKEKILIIEDDLSQLEIIHTITDTNNLTAFSAESGEQGFAFTFEFKPDFILIDLANGNKINIDTARDIRSIEEFNQIPIIGIVKNNNNQSEKTEYLKFCDRIIPQPITEKELISTLGEYVKSHVPIQKEPSIEEQFQFKIEEYATLKKIEKELNDEIAPLIKELEKRQPLNKVSKLRLELDKIAKRHGSRIIEDYSKEIDKSLKSFDIIKMRELIRNYEYLTKALHRKINLKK